MAEEFTLTPMRRLLKKHGDIRVSEEASEELRRIIGEYGSKIAGEAIASARRKNRRTVLARDIIAAKEKVTGVKDVD